MLSKALRYGLAATIVALISVPVNAAIFLSPASPNPPLVFVGVDPSGGNFTTADLVTVIGGGPYTEYYKQNVGGTEEGLNGPDYSTEFFNTPTDPEDATITWVGPGIISFDNMYLVVKDGNAHDPSVYVFDLVAAGWNGTETLVLTDFWPSQGAISHVSIMASRNPAQLPPPSAPEPTSLAIWCLGLVAAGFGARRMRKQK